MKLSKRLSWLLVLLFETICGSAFLVSGSVASSIDDPARKTYLNFELGASFSMDANMKVPDGTANAAFGGGYWDSAPAEGYDSDLGSSEEYGIGFGYNINPTVSLELNYNNRPSFSYSKFQNPLPSDIGPRIRYFDVSNNSIMFNGVVHLNKVSNALEYSIGSFSISPFVDAGLGISRNTVRNFRSVATKDGYVFSKMDGEKTTTSPAYQIGFGLATALDTFWEMKVGYRYFNGGDFKTQDYITDDPDNLHPLNPGAGTLVPVWKGTLQTNELYAKLVYHF